MSVGRYNITPDPRLESMMNDEETTMRTDYQIKPGYFTTTKYEPKPVCYRIRPPPLKFLHTMTDWRVPNVPFNLFWGSPSNPYKPQMPYYKPVDYERERVQKTRPRQVMTPAGSMDDVDEPARTVLLDDIYASSTVHLMREPIEHAAKNLRVQAPLPAMYSSTTPLAIPKLKPPFVSPEWRMDSANWDNRSLRAYTASTSEFWLRKGRENARREMIEEPDITPNKENELKNEARHA